MELRPGYKQTEVGVIPEDWEVLHLGGRASFKTGPFGSALHKSDYIENGVPWINPIHIVDGRLAPDSRVTVTQQAAAKLSDFRLRAKDIIIARRGDMGRCAVVQESQAGWLCGSGSMIIRCGPNIDPDFVQRILASPRAIVEIENASVGSTMNNLNQGVLANLKIQYPPSLAEQRAIAAALGDVDALLASLDRQIAKRRDLKQAAMQQLLTGQTRLPGFAGEWEVKRLGDHVTFLRNGVNPWADLTANDPVKYLHYGDIHACAAVMLAPANLPSLPSAKAKNLDRLRDGDLVFADVSEDTSGIGKSVEIFGVADTEFVSGLHTIVARFDKNVLADGFKGNLQFCLPFVNQLRRLAAGTKVYAISSSHIASIEMQLPSTAEQTAIAAVLSDMDAAMAALERRRAKTRDLKQAMMQQLLTGQTRLVPPGGPHA